jgi:hypothetical protein
VTCEDLAAKFPDWEIWTVPTAYQGTYWCARHRDDHKVVLNSARNADELGRDIADWYDDQADTLALSPDHPDYSGSGMSRQA